MQALHMEIPHKFPNPKESEILKEVTHEKNMYKPTQDKSPEKGTQFFQNSEGSSIFSILHESVSYSVVSDFATPGLQTTSLLCPRDSPGKNPGMGSHFLLLLDIITVKTATL